MQTRTTLCAAALLTAAAVAIGGLLTAGRVPAIAAEPAAKEPEGAAKDRRAEYIAAFNRGDAKALAGFWAEDAEYVDQDGHQYKGRADIEKMLERNFAEHKGAKLAIHLESAKQISPDVELEDGITDVTSANGDLRSAARFAAVLVRKDGRWFLQSVHDSEASPASTDEHLDDLAWLIGEWSGETEKGESVTATYELAEGQDFIVSTFATNVDGNPVAGGRQWIGWDAVDQKIRSWSFYSPGGVGEAVWTRDGARWLVKITAHTGDGKTVSATNVMTKLDDNQMTWQKTQITVNGESVPDRKPMKMKRVQEAQP
jgi:uncharacterized protein (TIGR02246 family)